MSVILDALKKLDREKSSRRNATANIAAEILAPDLSRSGRRIRPYVSIVTLAVVATAAITYGVMLKLGALSESLPRKSMKLPAPSEQVSPSHSESKSPSRSAPEPPNPPAQSQQLVPALISREPVSNVQEEASPVTPRTQIRAEEKAPVEIKPYSKSGSPGETRPPAISQEEKRAVIPEKTVAVPESAEKSGDSTSNTPSTIPSSFRLSAIVWSEEPSIRFAMINSIKVKEGDLIEGVKVAEINPTSVLFVHKGQYFEISLSR